MTGNSLSECNSAPIMFRRLMMMMLRRIILLYVVARLMILLGLRIELEILVLSSVFYSIRLDTHCEFETKDGKAIKPSTGRSLLIEQLLSCSLATPLC